jgi:hypothetical protein
MIDFAAEYPLIATLAAEYFADPFFIAAIRVAENGPPGKEFGVDSEIAAGYDAQCRAACATVRDQLFMYRANPLAVVRGPAVSRVVYTDPFIATFAATWAPPGRIPNDPTNLNANWLRNATVAYRGFVLAGAVE